MWIDGVSPVVVFDAYVAAVVALVVSGLIAARQQHAYSPIIKDAKVEDRVDWARVSIVVIILVAAIGANVGANLFYPAALDAFPVIGAAVWVAIFATAPWRKPDWKLLPDAFKGSLFLLCLVTIASMMPVEKLPPASWQSAFALGFISSVFDNIPLTALALKQGGYDWGMLAFCVGYGGSMIWFGSSAGVAISNLYPEAKSVGRWLRHGWHVALAYVVGFAVMLAIVGWHPTDKRGRAIVGDAPAAEEVFHPLGA
jgi:Na+/H+ antiporter NhaD/arsenite permease-like protein